MNQPDDKLPDLSKFYLGKSAEYWRDVAQIAWDCGDFKMQFGETRIKCREPVKERQPLSPPST